MPLVILLLIAMIPPVAFLVYVLTRDRFEPEPLSTVIRVFVFGALACFPAAFLESSFSTLKLFNLPGVLGASIHSFFLISPVEEFMKLGVVYLLVWKSRDFNEELDGIIYAGASSIGFALLENVFYVLSLGFATGILRGFTAIPLHTFTGILMGYFIGLAKMSPEAGKRNRLILLGFIAAWFTHGLYDTLALSGNWLVVFIPLLVIFFFIIGIFLLKRGVRLSAERWAGESAAPLPSLSQRTQERLARSDDGRRVIKPQKQTWKAVISRTLFIFLILFWGILLWSIFIPAPEGTEPPAVMEILIGGGALSFIPFLLALFLELSYRRNRKPRYLPDKYQHERVN